jgi:hypothetical protein
MAFLNITDDAKDWVANNLTQGQVLTNFNENFDAGIEDSLHSKMSISRSWYYNKYHDELLNDQIEAARAQGHNVPSSGDLNREWSAKDDPASDFNGGHVASYNKAIEKLRAERPGQEWLTYEEVSQRANQRVLDEAKEARNVFQDVSERASFGGAVGGFIGQAAGSMADPINIGITVATAPIAVEALGLSMLVNAGANTVAETAIQFAPGGVRDFAREQGLTNEQVNAETGMALAGAAVGGAALTGVIGGTAKGVKYLVGKIASGNPMEARAATQTLQAHQSKLPPEVQDQLKVISDAHAIEDVASFGTLNTKLSNVDAETLATNLRNYQEVSRAIADMDYSPDLKITAETVDVLKARASDLEGLSRDVASGSLTGREVDDVLSSYLTENQYARFRELVDHYTENPKVLMDQKAEINARLQRRMGEGMLTQAEKAKGDVEGRLADLQAQKTAIDSEVARLRAEAARDLPDPALLAKHGLDEPTATRLKEINERLAENIPKKERKALEGEYATIVASAKADIDAAKARLLDSASIKEGAAQDFAREIGIAEKQLRQAGDEVSRVGKIAAAGERRLQKMEANAPREEAEITAALEVLDEAKLVEGNKVAFAELYAMHPTVNPSKIRELVGLHEIRNRMRDGETLSVQDIVGNLTNKEGALFEDMLDKGSSLEDALDKMISKKSSFMDKETKAFLDRVAANIHEISNSFDERLNLEVMGEHLQRAADELKVSVANVDNVIASVQQSAKELIGDGAVTDKAFNDAMAYLNDNLDGRVIDPDTGLEVSVADLKAEIEKAHTLADLLEACKI